MIAMIDIDGVICNWVEGATPFIQALGKEPDLTAYGLGLALEEYKTVCDQMIESGAYLHLEPYAGAQEAVERWGPPIQYVTRRRPGHFPHLEATIRAQTRLWLLQNGFPYPRNLTFTQDKAYWCCTEKPRWAVEDYGPDAVKISKIVPCFLISRPWNEYFDYPLRVKSLADISAKGR